MVYFVMSDIHNRYDPMMKSLEGSGFDSNNPNHKIILVGDAFDKGDKPVEVYLFIKDMIANDKLIWIAGNHDLLVLKRLEAQSFNSYNETYDTLHEIAKYYTKKTELKDGEIFAACDKIDLKNFMYDNMVGYYETNNYLFVHGFIPVNKDYKDLDLLSWYSHTTKNGMKRVMVDGIRIPNKTIVCGHVRASYGNVRKGHAISEWDNLIFKRLQNSKKDLNNFKPYYGEGVIGIDGCCSETGMINCLIIED